MPSPQAMTGRRRLAILPARGGSKRIPRKNVHPFMGKPMIAHTLLEARAAAIFDRIHVSTDDEEIAGVALSYGADVTPRRPANLSDDITPLLPVARWILEQFEAQGERYDDVFILFPCSPLLEADDLSAAYDVYCRHDGKRNLLTVARAPVYPEWYFRRLDDGRLVPMTPGGSFVRGQDLEPAYYETGTFTIFSRDWLMAASSLEDDSNYISYELPSWKAVDIDEPEDIEFAEMLCMARDRMRLL
jgi:CMP-N-acetylneuraminic acid synthetase